MQRRGNSARCMFRELHAYNDYTELVSVADERWLVGFSRRGRRLAGDRWLTARQPRRTRRCYQFTKTDRSRHHHHDGSALPHVDYSAWYSRMTASSHAPR